jgi:hypothetical protein
MRTRKQHYKPLLSLVLMAGYATTAQSQVDVHASCSPTPEYTATPTGTPTFTATPTYQRTPYVTPSVTTTPIISASATSTPTGSSTITPASTITATPLSGTTLTPISQVPTPALSPTPVDVLVPFGCESKNTADIIATLDASANKILKISKLTASSLRKADRSAKIAAFTKKTVVAIQALNSQAWTQAWTIPTEITTNCISFSNDLCQKKDLSPLVTLYNDSVEKMNNETLKLNRKLKALDKKAANRLASTLRENLEKSLATSETLKVETLECKPGSAN